MKRYLFLAATMFACCTPVSAGVISNLLAGAQPGNLTFEDLSREAFIDIDNSGFLGAGDALIGYAKIETTFNPSTNAGNQIYAVFSQTFDVNSFIAQPVGTSRTRYSS